MLEVALRDEIDAPTGRRKTATVIGGSWLKPSEEATSLVDWAIEHASSDIRVWHLGVLMANYSFVAELCAEIGRRLSLADAIDTSELRAVMKGSWGDRDVVNVATRSSIRTLRSFGVITGDEGDPESGMGDQIVVDDDALPWLIHVLLVARGVQEIDFRDVKKAPELFMFDVPGKLINGYPYVERFSEGGGRQVVALVRQYGAAPKAAKQLRLGMDYRSN